MRVWQPPTTIVPVHHQALACWFRDDGLQSAAFCVLAENHCSLHAQALTAGNHDGVHMARLDRHRLGKAAGSSRHQILH